MVIVLAGNISEIGNIEMLCGYGFGKREIIRAYQEDIFSNGQAGYRNFGCVLLIVLRVRQLLNEGLEGGLLNQSLPVFFIPLVTVEIIGFFIVHFDDTRLQFGDIPESDESPEVLGWHIHFLCLQSQYRLFDLLQQVVAVRSSF